MNMMADPRDVLNASIKIVSDPNATPGDLITAISNIAKVKQPTVEAIKVLCDRLRVTDMSKERMLGLTLVKALADNPIYPDIGVPALTMLLDSRGWDGVVIKEVAKAIEGYGPEASTAVEPLSKAYRRWSALPERYLGEKNRDETTLSLCNALVCIDPCGPETEHLKRVSTRLVHLLRGRDAGDVRLIDQIFGGKFGSRGNS